MPCVVSTSDVAAITTCHVTCLRCIIDIMDTIDITCDITKCRHCERHLETVHTVLCLDVLSLLISCFHSNLSRTCWPSFSPRGLRRKGTDLITGISCLSGDHQMHYGYFPFRTASGIWYLKHVLDLVNCTLLQQ